VTEPASQPRTWRPMAFWSAGILLALGLAWFVAAVVVPHYPTWRIVREGASTWNWDYSGAVTRLGGSERAKAELRFYLKMPPFIAPHRAVALQLLYMTGWRSTSDFASALQETDDATREWAARILGYIGPDATAARPALEHALNDPAQRVRAAAAEALKKIGSQEPPK